MKSILRLSLPVLWLCASWQQAFSADPNRNYAMWEKEISAYERADATNPPPKGGIKVVLRVGTENWEIPRDSFFQNNFFLLPKLVEAARQCLKEGGARFLVDVYCGVGFFGIELGDLVETFVGVELDRLAIQAARRNAASAVGKSSVR